MSAQATLVAPRQPHGPAQVAAAPKHRAWSAKLGARAMAKLNIEMNPDDTKAHLQLAQIELAAGNREEAGRVVREVLAKDPENRHAKRMQMELAK